MFDFLNHLLDAPFANILIVAGLIFLGIGAVGKISGKIEPGIGGRIMCGVLGLVLLVVGIQFHSSADKARDYSTKESPSGPPQVPQPKPQHSEFSGEWANADPNTRGITKLLINETGSQFTVRAWGSCHPQDCDWGTEPAARSGTTAAVAWDQGFVLRKMTLAPEGSRLHVVVDSVYRDNRPPGRMDDYFVKRQ